MFISKSILLDEFADRKELTTSNILDRAFDQQKAFIRDPARLKALFCTRRAAKSYTDGLYLADTATQFASCNVLYLGLTRQSAHGIIWKDILQDINKKDNMNMRFNASNLTATLPNGSVIWATGADATEEEMNKLLGKKYRLVIVDEASFFTIDMRQLIYGVLKPATADDRGTICVSGTASNIKRGLFFDITQGKEPGWSLHEWSAHDNPHVAKQWQEELDDIAKNRPEFMKTALFQQWYLNKWVIDDDAKVYKFNADINRTNSLPAVVDQYRFVLGVDLAHSPDSSAFVIGAYHPDDPKLYIKYARKFLKMDVTAVADKIRELELTHDFEVKVIDGQNKMAVEELNTRHGLQLIPADKTGKVDFINIMNAEFIQGKILLLPGTEELQEEYDTLVWVTDNGKVIEPKKEHPTIHNDCADGALYLWRHCYQYLFKTPVKRPIPGTLESWEPEHIKKLQDKVRKEQNPNELDIDFDDDLFRFEDDE